MENKLLTQFLEDCEIVARISLSRKVNPLTMMREIAMKMKLPVNVIYQEDEDFRPRPTSHTVVLYHNPRTGDVKARYFSKKE
jgi:hypothetical protein